MAKSSQPVTASYIQQFSELAGPFQPKEKALDENGALRFIRYNSTDRRLFRAWTVFIAYASLYLVIALMAFLFMPQHWVLLKPAPLVQKIFDGIMLGCLAVLQLFLLAGTYMVTRSTLRAKDPIPMAPVPGLRVALATTRAPGEPVGMVRQTLLAAKQVRYEQGSVDVWLLDETRDKDLEHICRELGVYYFSRKDVAAWNIILVRRGFFKRRRGFDTDSARLAARTKHGNFNAWGSSGMEGKRYDIIAGVDTDQVPQPNFLERMLGYFNDPDVAYVVGPQVYANHRPGLAGLVTRWADSQASFFQSTIQRAANASTSAMFVGTNYVVRSQALSQVKGFYPCITEDLATGIAIQSNRNPQTGRHWKSVYTPDVLALGEGPSLWGSYFTQQWRWAAGAFDATGKLLGSVIKGLQPKARVHYLLLLVFYPIGALTWVISVLSSLLYVLVGASAINVSWSKFISLYLMSLVLQLGIYFWNHRGDVSPFTPPGSYGIAGMAITSLTAPIYFSALCGKIFGRTVKFVVTKKGESAGTDSLSTFSLQLKWVLLLGIGLLYGFTHNHHNAAMMGWLGLQLVVCLVPLTFGMISTAKLRLNKQSHEPVNRRTWLRLARSSNA